MSPTESKIKENAYYIGFDMNDDESFMCYWDSSKNRPEAFHSEGGFGTEQIPTIVTYLSYTKEWIVGQEAMLIQPNDGIYRVGNFVSELGTDMTYRIDRKEYTGEEILTVFFQSALSSIHKVNPNGYIAAIMVTTHKVNNQIIKTITTALEDCGIEDHKIYVQSYLESSVGYIISENLPQKKSGIFELTKAGLRYYQITSKMNGSTQLLHIEKTDLSKLFKGENIDATVINYLTELYVVARDKKLLLDARRDSSGRINEGNEQKELSREEKEMIRVVYEKNKQFIFSKIMQKDRTVVYFQNFHPPLRLELDPDYLYGQLSQFDIQFKNISDEILQSNLTTAIFLVGSGFQTAWTNHSLKSLLVGRRVFQGQNLFSLGACFNLGVQEELVEKPKVLVTGCGILTNNYGIMAISSKKEEFIEIIKAGTTWYGSDGSIDVLLDRTDEIEIISREGSSIKTVCKLLLNLPKRPNMTTKVNIRIYFISELVGKVEITDIGLGQIAPGSHKMWSQTFPL